MHLRHGGLTPMDQVRSRFACNFW